MPIYAYRCDACGFAKDVLQKMSDAQLTVCPTCQKDTFKKQVTAAGFQLKGTGWYVTDFRGGAATGEPAAKGATDGAPAAAPAAAAAASNTESSTSSASSTSSSAATTTTAPASATTSKASSPAAT